MMKKEFYDMKVRFFGVLIIMAVLFFLVAPFQRFTVSILDEHSNDPLLKKFLPKETIQRLSEWNFYINTQWFGKNFGQLIPIIGIIIGFPLFAREAENETIQFLLVRLSRKSIFINKFFTGLFSTIILLFFSGIIPIIFSVAVNKDYNYIFALKFTTQAIFAGILWYTIALFYSVLFNDQVKPLLAGLGTLAITTVAGLLRPLKFFNTFNYSLGISIFERNSIDTKYTVWIIIVSAVLTFLAYSVFTKKEF